MMAQGDLEVLSAGPQITAWPATRETWQRVGSSRGTNVACGVACGGLMDAGQRNEAWGNT
jgi:hypothetical protein